MAKKEKATVATRNAIQSQICAKAELPRTLMGGTQAMREAGTQYLPQELAESDTAYGKRLNDTFLFNAYANAVESLVGKVFADAPTVETSNADIEAWAENIDNNGRDLARFAKDILEDAFHPGISYILVDYSTSELPPNATVEDVKKAGLRPYWTHISAENLIAWQSININGVDQLTRIQILETTVETDGWDEVVKEQVKVLYPGKVEIYEMGDDKEWHLAKTFPTTIDFIPLVPVYTKRTGFMNAKPLLDDLAEKNCEHWVTSSDYRRILHVSMAPILAASGLEDSGSVVIGLNRLFKMPQGAKLEYVEHTGAAIESGRKHLEDLKGEMEVLALQPLVKRPGSKTATESSIESAKSHSVLQGVVESFEDCLELAFQYTMMWIGETSDVTVELNKDFGLTETEQAVLDMLFKTRNAKDISRKAYLTELKMRGVLNEDYDIDKDMDEIEAEPIVGMPNDFTNVDKKNPKKMEGQID